VLLIAAIVFFLVLPNPWNETLGLICLLLFLGEVFWWNRSVRSRHHATGPERMIGRTAVTIGECRPRGQVRLDGEIWEARCADGAGPGEMVVVTGREKLTLLVVPHASA
jgi:membrane protein implicated in regulation of membrane protease activity